MSKKYTDNDRQKRKRPTKQTKNNKSQNTKQNM